MNKEKKKFSQQTNFKSRLGFTKYRFLFTEGPMSHDQPAYARVPGIRVYGMMCNSGNVTNNNRNARLMRPERSSGKNCL